MNNGMTLLQRLPIRQDIGLITLIMMTLAMMVLPMPTEVADILIAISIGISVLLLMAAVYLGSPADFYTFPSVILLTTIFRLSISITTSRLVLTQADAGDIIRTFGEFVIAGNVVVGLVVFLIISVVQFVVITKGAERVAEVAARFALDSMPGKQMSIDNDAKTGVIKPDEAKRRRAALQRESQLFGAMDGAMKFVKGDAIASLMIIAVNLVGGIAIGCAQRGMSMGQAGATYSLLAIGDGLIAQIPALLISLASGLVVTRVGGDENSNLGVDIVKQIGSDPRALLVGSGILLGLGLIPGFPMLVFLALAASFGVSGWMMQRHRLNAKHAESAAFSKAANDVQGKSVVCVRIGRDLSAERPMIETALEQLQSTMSDELGITLPRILTLEAEAGSDGVGLCVEMNRVPLLSVPLRANEMWSDVRVDGAAVRVGPGGREWSVMVGSKVDQPGARNAVDVIVYFVRQLLLRTMGQLVGIQETQTVITRTEQAYGELVREAMRSAPLPRLAEVLRRLLEERVSIRDMRQVLEAVAEWAPRESATAILSEHVRVALRRQISHAAADANMTLAVLLVEDDLAERLLSAVRQTMSGDVLELENADDLAENVRATLQEGIRLERTPVIITTFELRRHLANLLRRHGVDAGVMSHAELAPDYQVDVIGTIGLSALRRFERRDLPKAIAGDGSDGWSEER